MTLTRNTIPMMRHVTQIKELRYGNNAQRSKSSRENQSVEGARPLPHARAGQHTSLSKQKMYAAIDKGKWEGDSSKLPDPSCPGLPQQLRGNREIGPTVNTKIFKGMKHGVFVEFGAADGEFMSNSVDFARKACWRGVCLEPTENIYKDLVKFRPDCINVNGAVCDREGKRVFWDVQTGPKHPDKRGAGRWTVCFMSFMFGLFSMPWSMIAHDVWYAAQRPCKLHV